MANAIFRPEMLYLSNPSKKVLHKSYTSFINTLIKVDSSTSIKDYRDEMMMVLMYVELGRIKSRTVYTGCSINREFEKLLCSPSQIIQNLPVGAVDGCRIQRGEVNQGRGLGIVAHAFADYGQRDMLAPGDARPRMTRHIHR